MQINVTNPVQQTVFFSILFLIAILLTIKRKPAGPFFGNYLTDEIKGFAILTVIFSHIGYFLSTNDKFLFPLSILAGVGVNLFLFLSGYGLTISSLNNKLPLLNFYKKRLAKIFIPLWLILPLIIILDKIVLNRTYPLENLLQNFLGFFPTGEIFTDLDSPLWYFSFILFYYLIFPLLFFKKFPILSILLILISSLLFVRLNLPIHLDVLKLYKLHVLAFPLGMAFALFIKESLKEKIIYFFKSQKLPIWLPQSLALLIFIPTFVYFSFNAGVGEGLVKEQFLGQFITLLVILIFLLINIRVKFLSILGGVSYEIYLIHWPLLYRFDLFYKFLPPYLATITYLLFFIFLGLLFQKISSFISRRIT